MKTFSTSGTGSQQSLSEIENNKIPVYDTKTDAESDLANLTVGQIIATKDEGNETSTPVDVVEDGNMHAVTSNAVAGMIGKVTTVTNDNNLVKWIDMPNGFTDENCFIIGKSLLYSDTNIYYCEDKDIQILMSMGNTNQIGICVNKTGFYNKTIDIFLMKKTS